MVYGSDYTDAVSKFNDAWGALVNGGYFGGFEGDFDMDGIRDALMAEEVALVDGKWVYREVSADRMTEIVEGRELLGSDEWWDSLTEEEKRKRAERHQGGTSPVHIYTKEELEALGIE